MFKNFAPFTDCITELNNTQKMMLKKIDVVMPMYKLIEYSDGYLKTLGSLWQHCRDETALGNKDNVIDFPDDKNNTAL